MTRHARERLVRACGTATPTATAATSAVPVTGGVNADEKPSKVRRITPIAV